MSTPWDKVAAAALSAEKAGDLDTASDLRHVAAVLESSAEREAAAATRRAGSNAFRTDEQEAALREENQNSFYRVSRGR